jgi:hypothetical protein
LTIMITFLIIDISLSLEDSSGAVNYSNDC